MTHEGTARREKWKFNGRAVVDGVPHLGWKFDKDQTESRGRHRAEAPDWEWGCPVDDFRKVTICSASRSAGQSRNTPVAAGR